MQKTPFDQILDQLASDSRSDPAEVREKLRVGMASALESSNPAVQAMWNTIPRRGSRPTLEEFMDYLIKKQMLQP